MADAFAIRAVTGQDYLKVPGPHRRLLGAGLATSLADFLGGRPNTRYSEVTGAVALTKTFHSLIMTVAAVIAVVVPNLVLPRTLGAKKAPPEARAIDAKRSASNAPTFGTTVDVNTLAYRRLIP